MAHILIRNSKEGNTALNTSPPDKINEIHDSLLAGVNFADLAKKFSDDKKSAVNGGELDWFGTNKMVKKFEDVAFTLDSINKFSMPFQTEFGWHIVKLIDKKSLPPFEEIKASLKKRIERDSRSQKTRNVVLEKLKKEWGFVENIHAKKIFYNIIDENFVKGCLTTNGTGHIVCISISMIFNSVMFIRRLYEFVLSFQSRLNSKNTDNYNSIVDELYNTFKEQKILEIESTNLENKYDDFRLLYNDSQDGILMYQLQKDEVWDKAITDTLGLQTYFSENQQNYVWPNRLDAHIYSCKDVNIRKKVFRKLKRGVTGTKLLNDINKSSSLNLSMQDGVFANGDNSLVDIVFSIPFDSIQQGHIVLAPDNHIVYIDSLRPTSYKY